MTQASAVELWSASCRALLLDLDGTLADSSAAVLRGWQVWGRDNGVPEEEIEKVVHGRGAAEAITLLRPDITAAEMPGHVRQILSYQEVDPDPAAPLPGAAELVAGIGGRPWAVVTACSARLARARLAAAGICEPPVLIGDEDVTLGKPDPQGYLLALRRLGVQAGDAVVVEDAPPGVHAARAAGIRVVAVTTTHDPQALADADVVVPGLTHLQITQSREGMRVSVTGGTRAL